MDYKNKKNKKGGKKQNLLAQFCNNTSYICISLEVLNKINRLNATWTLVFHIIILLKGNIKADIIGNLSNLFLRQQKQQQSVVRKGKGPPKKHVFLNG